MTLMTIMFALWVVLIAILVRGTYREFRKKKWAEGIVFTAITITILIFTSGWAVLYVFLVGCAFGLDLPCRL